MQKLSNKFWSLTPPQTRKLKKKFSKIAKNGHFQMAWGGVKLKHFSNILFSVLPIRLELHQENRTIFYLYFIFKKFLVKFLENTFFFGLTRFIITKLLIVPVGETVYHWIPGQILSCLDVWISKIGQQTKELSFSSDIKQLYSKTILDWNTRPEKLH